MFMRRACSLPGVMVFGRMMSTDSSLLLDSWYYVVPFCPTCRQPLADAKTDATVCASDDGKRPGLIGNVKSFVRDQRGSLAGSLGCGSHMCSSLSYQLVGNLL